MGAVLLNGVYVGAGSVIGAGALLTEGMQVPSNSVVMGIPAKIVRQVDDELRGRIRITWQHYIEQARSHRSGERKMHRTEPPTDL
jgi:carbonic anhydrase/acetyltransferase-like protein (isoleucine patch superfamily)